jgi:hypothetical protein
MAITSRTAWVSDGRPFKQCVPALDLRATLGRHGYTGPATGYPDARHLTAVPPEDHCPFSHTPWPGQQPYPYCMAIDIMPSAAFDWIELGTRLVADKNAGVPGTQAIKYINWTDSSGHCWNDGWTPNHTHGSSTDGGHVHVSFRTDYVTSHVMANYDPLEDRFMATINQADWDALIWRQHALINNLPVVVAGPTKGEVNQVHDQLAAILTASQSGGSGGVSPAQVKEIVDATIGGSKIVPPTV